jgi:hypothetical protein
MAIIDRSDGTSSTLEVPIVWISVCDNGEELKQGSEGQAHGEAQTLRFALINVQSTVENLPPDFALHDEPLETPGESYPLSFSSTDPMRS